MTEQPHDDIFEQYWRHAAALRQWFVAYGIGGVVLFLTNRPLFSALSPCALKTVAAFFLAGVLFQVVLAFINKVFNYNHWLRKSAQQRSEEDSDSTSWGWFRLDIVLDALTVLSFVGATITLVVLL